MGDCCREIIATNPEINQRLGNILILYSCNEYPHKAREGVREAYIVLLCKIAEKMLKISSADEVDSGATGWRTEEGGVGGSRCVYRGPCPRAGCWGVCGCGA